MRFYIITKTSISTQLIMTYSLLQVTPLCSGSEFSCEVPECVDANRECNFRSECSDGSDEKFCGMSYFCLFLLPQLDLN